MIYTQDLYKNVIEEPAVYCNNLKVISGYASSKFLKKVIKDLPNHKICLIIGMASQGISKSDHEEFKKICTDRNNVEVFYKTEAPPNHMKVYQWYSDEVPGVSFIGSANFSDSGFFKHEEILSPVLDKFSNLIDHVLSQSICCLDDQVESKIPLYESIELDLSESGEDISDDQKQVLDPSDDDSIDEYKNPTKDNGINLKKLLLNNFQFTPNNNTTVKLILEDSPHWETKALNNWTREGRDKNDSYIDIERTNKLGIKKLDFFPRNVILYLISDDNVEWTVERAGEYGRELRTITGISFYEYFKKRLGIKQERPISYEDLRNYGRTDIQLYKLSDSEYLLDFSLENKA